jgi:hypothetical protein
MFARGYRESLDGRPARIPDDLLARIRARLVDDAAPMFVRHVQFTD